MKPLSLLLSTVQLLDSAEYSLREAAACADPGKGPVQMVAAMSTAFPVILAFGELLEGKRTSDRKVFENFCTYMPWEWWLIPLTDEKPDNPAELLCKLRNAMTHTLGLTAGIALTPSKAGLGWARERGDRFAIMPAQFVDAVGRAMYDIVARNPDLDAAHLFMEWDRFPAVMIRTPAAA
jgi:hypothetical protein